MRYERPSSEFGTGNADLLYGESSHEVHGTHDERKLYGEPRHEVASNHDEQTLYGEPQHETRDEARQLPDLELLFARMQVESATGPAVRRPESDPSRAKTTEQ